MINETVEKDRSPPDNERVSLETRLVPCSTFTYKNWENVQYSEA